MGMLFDVRVTAFDPHAGVDPVEALMRLFKIDRGFAREVVHRLPRVIKRGVPLETAQRLGQVLERIGAHVEILVSERTEQPAGENRARSQQRAAGSARASMPQTASGRGLPPPSAAVLAQSAAAGPASVDPVQVAAALMRRSAETNAAPRVESRASLPNGVAEEGAVPRAVSALLEARTARALREQASRASLPDPSLAAAAHAHTAPRDLRTSLPDASLAAAYAPAATRDLRSTHRPDLMPPQEDAFGAEMPSASVRAVLRDAGASANLARASLPLGHLSEAEAEDSGVTSTLPSASLPQAAPENDAERPSLQLPPGKPSVKEILARRSLSQTSPGVERISRITGELAPPNAAPGALLTLPTFSARGSPLTDDIEELPETVALRKRYATVTWILLFLASLASFGLFAVGLFVKLFATRRRRLAQLRELSASALLVGQSQLPELYHCVKQLAIRLEISPSPRLYVAERCPHKVQAFLQRGMLVIVLDARLLSSAARFDAGYIVQFALAHVIASYALEQHTWWRKLLSQLWTSLAKSELFSADALAAKLMSDRNEPVRALASLLCGPELAHLVDLNELERQTTSQEQEAKLHGESTEDATYLLPRIQRLRRLAQAKT